MPARSYHKRGELVDGYFVKKHPLYNTWVLIRQRCLNQNSKAYEHYGGRGIKVCERWGQFKNFAEDMGPRPSPKHSVDRINNDGNYEPSNCRWATVNEQRLNRRCFYTSESGVTGVRQTSSLKYQAIVHINNKRHYLGLFSTVEEAKDARQRFLKERAGRP